MSSSAEFAGFRRLLVLVFSLALVLWAWPASAAGRVEWKSKEIKEREGGWWRVELAIYLPSAPDVAHVPMRFEFQPTAYYDRSMVDGDKLVERMIPLSNKQSLIESVDVGFLDSGSGKIEKRTRFTFKVTRAHGYEAGEYKVTIRDGRNRNTVGTPVTLKFVGDNPVIDRRAMVFSGEKKKKPKAEEPGAKTEEEAKKAAEAPKGEGDTAQEATKRQEEPGEAQDAANEESASEDDTASNDSDGPPSIQEKPGGCGCRVKPSGASSAAWFGFALLLGSVVFRRRLRSA